MLLGPLDMQANLPPPPHQATLIGEGENDVYNERQMYRQYKRLKILSGVEN